jgi:hypothetical protein
LRNREGGGQRSEVRDQRSAVRAVDETPEINVQTAELFPEREKYGSLGRDAEWFEPLVIAA